jgi:hypothetical protein
MFILAYVAIVIMRANEIVIPSGVSKAVGIVAILEGLFYLTIVILNIVIIVSAWRD